MNTLLLGADGMLGRAVSTVLAPDHELTTPARHELDITHEAQLRSWLTPGIELVINCAAYTDVDQAEQQEDTATLVNGHAVGWIAKRAAEIDATLVHYSTDYVFDGQANRPYAIGEERAPLGAYGRSKLLGERLLQQSGSSHLLLRTSWLYAPWGKNFVLTMLSLMKTRPELSVVDDQIGRPSSALGVARATRRLIEKGERGVVHVTDAGQTSWFGFAREIAKLSASTCQVTPCTSQQFPRTAPRPAYSVLDISKTERLLGPLPSWQRQLTDTLRALGALSVPGETS